MPRVRALEPGKLRNWRTHWRTGAKTPCKSAVPNRSRKPLGVQAPRGFKSLPLRKSAPLVAWDSSDSIPPLGGTPPCCGFGSVNGLASTILGGDGTAPRRRDDELVHGRRHRPSGNAPAPSAAVTATTLASADTTGPTAPGNLYAFDFGCETWLFWDESIDDVDPQDARLGHPRRLENRTTTRLSSRCLRAGPPPERRVRSATVPRSRARGRACEVPGR